MKRIVLSAILIPFLGLCTAFPAFAHFGMIIPSDTMIMQDDNRTIQLTLSFSHPFEGLGMELAKPNRFGVFSFRKESTLIDKLKKTTIMGHSAWRLDYRIKRPGIYIFYMEPVAYWEPAEDCFIIHYTKTVIAAFGDDEGWDAEIGLKTEIVPLSKPFGLYAGNVFQGIVKLNRQMVPDAEVEVEYYNEGRKSKAPTDYMITQTIKSDSNGVFTYAVPKSGWWGFAALNSADYKMKKNGTNKDVELGAVLWVRFHSWEMK